MRIVTSAYTERSYSICGTRYLRAESVCRSRARRRLAVKLGTRRRRDTKQRRHRPRGVRGRRATSPIVIGALWSGDETALLLRPEVCTPVSGTGSRWKVARSREPTVEWSHGGRREVTRVGQATFRIRDRTVRPEYESITIERGGTHDQEFEAWARRTSEGHGQDAPLHRDIVIRHTTKPGVVSASRLVRCWVSEFQAVPDLDANANAVAIEHLKLEHEGLEAGFLR